MVFLVDALRLASTVQKLAGVAPSVALLGSRSQERVRAGPCHFDPSAESDGRGGAAISTASDRMLSRYRRPLLSEAFESSRSTSAIRRGSPVQLVDRRRQAIRRCPGICRPPHRLLAAEPRKMSDIAVEGPPSPRARRSEDRDVRLGGAGSQCSRRSRQAAKEAHSRRSPALAIDSAAQRDPNSSL